MLNDCSGLLIAVSTISVLLNTLKHNHKKLCIGYLNVVNKYPKLKENFLHAINEYKYGIQD